LVPVESIDEPISAIPNIGGDPGDIIFVRAFNTWSDCFTDYIAMCHGRISRSRASGENNLCIGNMNE
jgi:hypothetical protein